MGLYLLFIGMTDVKIVAQNNYTQLACASLYLSQRMIRRDLKWHRYLREITQLEYDFFSNTCYSLASVYVQLVNNEDAYLESYRILLAKFSLEMPHKSVANFVPVRSSGKK